MALKCDESSAMCLWQDRIASYFSKQLRLIELPLRVHKRTPLMKSKQDVSANGGNSRQIGIALDDTWFRKSHAMIQMRPSKP
jgi:hypothetical protein